MRIGAFQHKDTIDPASIRGEIVEKERVVVAKIYVNGQKEYFSVEYFDIPYSVTRDPLSDWAKEKIKELRKEAEEWIRLETNKYKYPY